MSRIFSSGFEYNSTAIDWSGVTSFTIASSNARSGTYCGHISAPASANNVRWIFSSSNIQVVHYSRVYIRVDAYPTATLAFFGVRNVATAVKITVRLTTAGKLQLYNSEDSAQIGSDSSQVLALGQYYCIELKVDFTTLSAVVCEARIDQVSFASGTANISTGIGNWIYGTPADATLDLYYDDIAVNDNSGSVQNSWPGPGKLLYLWPSAAGDTNTFATQTGGTAGAANNFTRVNERTPDAATTLNGSSTLNEEDMFNVTDSGLTLADTVTLVELDVYLRNNVADATTTLKCQIEKTSGGTITQGTAIVMNSTTWGLNANSSSTTSPTLVAYTDPDGAAWTSATLDSMQIGYKLTLLGVNRIDVSNIVAIVDYIPGGLSHTTKYCLLGVG